MVLRPNERRWVILTFIRTRPKLNGVLNFPDRSSVAKPKSWSFHVCNIDKISLAPSHILACCVLLESDININDAHPVVGRYPGRTMSIKISVLQLPDYDSDSHIKHRA